MYLTWLDCTPIEKLLHNELTLHKLNGTQKQKQKEDTHQMVKNQKISSKTLELLQTKFNL